jgi:hypothetical protein
VALARQGDLRGAVAFGAFGRSGLGRRVGKVALRPAEGSLHTPALASASCLDYIQRHVPMAMGDRMNRPIQSVQYVEVQAQLCAATATELLVRIPRLKNGGIHIVLVVVFSRPGATRHFPEGSGACV